jgi:hypothetical protein
MPGRDPACGQEQHGRNADDQLYSSHGALSSLAHSTLAALMTPGRAHGCGAKRLVAP